MKILRPPRDVWTHEADCTECGARLLVEKEDLQTREHRSDSIYHREDPPETTTVFVCPCCGVNNEVPESDLPQSAHGT